MEKPPYLRIALILSLWIAGIAGFWVVPLLSVSHFDDVAIPLALVTLLTGVFMVMKLVLPGVLRGHGCALVTNGQPSGAGLSLDIKLSYGWLWRLFVTQVFLLGWKQLADLLLSLNEKLLIVEWVFLALYFCLLCYVPTVWLVKYPHGHTKIVAIAP